MISFHTANLSKKNDFWHPLKCGLETVVFRVLLLNNIVVNPPYPLIQMRPFSQLRPIQSKIRYNGKWG
ncbi:hypothetical protein DNU06_05855 [Putridiphycobacter roseus]|uniref:Uncharacterized protein n=1 Tax=Putridiphycobacter roseus TaxID=2219161 RepID=A0A2W1N3J4_9FLAO|nr:hypothetical protein DNU06_05855 [Putridiphycobacter roseus]